MEFNFTGEIAELLNGIEILSKRLGFGISEKGIVVDVVKHDGDIEISCVDKKVAIKYKEKIHFFRMLGLLCENCGKDFYIREEPKFTSNGIMIDASRNAVMKVEKIKDFIEIMAVMGLNLIMMYTEDTYEVPQYPYFGYMRGRYTYDELRECDQYASLFGIEMIPCVQTLAHLARALKWNHGLNIKDTDDILLVGSEDTYTFIRNLLKAATKPYRSNRIHIGMDEAGNLGLGDYLGKNGYHNKNEIIKEHFNKVHEIVKELGLDAMMWSDMYFQANGDSGYYNTDIEFPEEVIKSVPKDLTLVYWDYEHYDEDFYDKMISNHKKLNDKMVFAGGIWMWGSMTISYRQATKTIIPALNSCIKNGVKEVFATMWGDNGNQVNIYEALYGMQIFAEIGYGHNADDEHMKNRFKTCTKEDKEAFLALDLLDDFGQYNLMANPSEYLLWQDVLMGLVDKHAEGYNTDEHYKMVSDKMKEYENNSVLCKGIFEYSYYLSRVLEIKANLGNKLKKCYDEKDKEKLNEILEKELPELEQRLTDFKNVFRKLWFKIYKPFGWEVMDMRFGNLFARIETAKYRLKQFLNSEIDKIEELEEERLYFHLDDWQKLTCTDFNLRTVTYLKYVNAGNSSMGYCD